MQIRLTWAVLRLELPCEAAHIAAVYRVDLDLRPPDMDRVSQRTSIDAPSARITLDHRQEVIARVYQTSMTQRRSTVA
ncbi:hypothetical protein [Streptomyces sp. NPDC006355]|uniref:hypothetical protein n=1 Tax=Streptomyces sp. NPDC006355 TaxID=3156758 RepID=UPI0033BAE0DB